MADVAAVRLTNIVTVTQGSNVYKGVRSFSIQTDAGVLRPILEEGNQYVTGVENLGLSDFPVRTQMVFEQDAVNMIAALAEANASLVIVVKKAAGAGNETITIVNHQFKSISQPQSLQDVGRQAINGVAYSADGAALPISAS